MQVPFKFCTQLNAELEESNKLISERKLSFNTEYAKFILKILKSNKSFNNDKRDVKVKICHFSLNFTDRAIRLHFESFEEIGVFAILRMDIVLFQKHLARNILALLKLNSEHAFLLFMPLLLELEILLMLNYNTSVVVFLIQLKYNALKKSLMHW